MNANGTKDRFGYRPSPEVGVEMRSMAHELNVSANEFIDQAVRRLIAHLRARGVRPRRRISRLRPGRPLKLKRP